MKKTALLAAIILTAALCAEAGALSLEEAREAALANSKTLAQYNLDIRTADLTKKTAGYGMLPSLSLGASASAKLWESPSKQWTGVADTISAGASVSVSQKIYDGGKISLQKAISSISSEITRKDAMAAYFTVLDTADNYYYAVLEAAAALAAAESSLETASLSLSLAEVRRESGVINPGDYLQAQAEKQARETARNQARRDLAMSRARLAELTGQRDVGELDPVDFSLWEDLFQKLAGLDDPGLDALYRLLWDETARRNPSLLKAALSSSQAESSLSLAKRDYLPSLSASFSTGINYSRTANVEPAAGSLSLSLSIPLDFWTTAANVEKSRTAAEKTALGYRSSEASLELELQSALINLVSQAGSILSSRKAWEYAGSHFDYVMELYRLSRNSPSDLADAGTLVRTNYNQMVGAQYQFLRAVSALRSLGAFESEEEIIALLIEGILE